ncbi:MAG: ATP-binding protein, partial [Bacteroidia bacterium]
AWVDPLRLKQVLINLMSNGVKFTEKGYVKLKVDFEQKANDIGLFTFTVKDTGIGISKSQKNKLFKAFSQADASYTRRFGGTGLGLVISHRLVANMGGEIEIKSNIDEGSEFSFGLLLKCKKADARASNKVIKKETEIKITTKHKLMVVEDMEENRMLANILLKKFAPNSIATDAVNGMEAFEMYKKTRPELILMDVQMPVLDGNRATELIRRYEKFNGLKPCKIVGLSAGVLAHEREKCLSSGMNDFMAKPIETEKFQQVLCKYLNRNPQTNTKAINQVNQSTLVQSESETMRFDINELNSLMGDETMVKVLLKQLLISLPKRLADLETCFNNNDLSQAAKAAHALKGAALNARCNIMGKMAAKAEHCLKNNEHIDTTETMNQLNQEWHLLKNVLKSRL